MNCSSDTSDVEAYVPRTSQEIRENGNHLKNERSVYLLQHAHNPLDWYPWGDEAIERARSENKPIFLSIGYSSCHWCHVMEEEVFEKDDVAEFMNANFICIKVDREERPDLDTVYMNAVQAITGGGGWPMSVFLTPDLKPFFGGTYFPHDRFMMLIRRVHDAFNTQRADIDQQAARLFDAISRPHDLAETGVVDPELFAVAAQSAASGYDDEWGGFRTQRKFPTPLRWKFVLRNYRKTNDERAAEIVRGTLDHMGSGGIHDQIGGGFHRYTVEGTWLIPHFEKMLYDNAQIASLYIEASAVFDDPAYAEIAKKTLDFMIRDMSDDGRGFYGSYDADSGGEEGTFYIWSPDEITEVAGPEDGPPLAMLLSVTEAGNFEGKSVLTRRVSTERVAETFGRPLDEIDGLIDKWTPNLREHRSARVWPGLDKKIVTSWNGLAISAMAQGYGVFGDERYRVAAEKTVDFLWERHRRNDGLFYRASTNGTAENEAVLDDYAFLSDGLIELYLATGDASHLQRALELIETAVKRFAHPTAGFYLTADTQEAPMGRQVEIIDSVRPSGNSAMLSALLRAATLTGNTNYRDIVERTLSGFAGQMDRLKLEMAGWLDVAQLFVGPYYEVIIAGDPDGATTRALVSAFRKVAPANAVLVTVGADGPSADLATLLGPAAGKTAVKGEAAAYVCRFGSCKLPTSDPATLRAQLLEGWSH